MAEAPLTRLSRSPDPMAPTRLTTTLLACVALLASLPGHSHSAPVASKGFFDVPEGHVAYDAVVYLREKGILDGYADGTFRPDKQVNRAEALKIIATQLLSDDKAASYISSPFTDVPKGTWYLPYVEWARAQGGIIQAPPTVTVFSGGRTVTKAEFLKMFFASRKVDPNAFGDITLPLSRDVPSTKEWYYSPLRYAVASSITVATKEGLLKPQRELTRSDVAVFLHRYFLYRQGERTQPLLAEAKKEVDNVINFLSAGNLREAQYASARGILVSRGANEMRSEEPVVQVAVKISEGCRALVRAYEAAQKEDWGTVVKLSQDAWFLGEQARKITPAAKELSAQLQQYAKSFADQARANQ